MNNLEDFPANVKRFLIAKALASPSIKRLVLFGSRARGDARARSDFDLAVIAPGMDHPSWSQFALEVKENIPTLCGIDLLLLNDKIAPPLQARIQKEGVVIYERAA